MPDYIHRHTWDVGAVTSHSAASARSSSHEGLPRISYATWVAAGSESPSPGLAFVEDYSVYFAPDVAGGFASREARRVYPVSDPGLVRAEVVTHGVPDWVYEGG